MDNFIIDGFIKAASLNKKAQLAIDEETCKLLSSYAIFTRALYLVHQQNHWRSTDHGDHLLFGRLYEETSEMSDKTSENIISVCDDILFKGQEVKILIKFSPEQNTREVLLISSINAEKAFLRVCDLTREKLQEKDQLSISLDNLIAGNADQSTHNLYLLQQALKGVKE